MSEYNEKKKQELNANFVNEHVLLNQTYLVDKMLNDEVFSYESIINLYPDNTEKIEELEDKITELEDEQDEPQEILEWWVISNWFAEQLKEHGEPVLENDYGTWWGRTTTGQAIKLDDVITEIREELENKINKWR